MASHTSTLPLLGFKQVQCLFPSEQCLAGNRDGSVPLYFSHSPWVSAPCPQLPWMKWIPCSRQCTYQAVLCPVLFCTLAGETLPCTAHCDECSLLPTRGATSWLTWSRVGLRSLENAALLCPEHLLCFVQNTLQEISILDTLRARAMWGLNRSIYPINLSGTDPSLPQPADYSSAAQSCWGPSALLELSLWLP